MNLDPALDLSAIAEQQCRIEHKLDLIIEYLAKKDGDFALRVLADPDNSDPLTQEPVTYFMDLFKRHVIRRTSLANGTGLISPSSVLFTSANSSTGNTNGGKSGTGTE